MLHSIKTVLLCAALPLMLAIGACSSEEEDEQIILRVANWGSPAVEGAFMELERQFNAEFEAAHPGVRVQVEQIPGHGQYAPKVVMMHVSGNPPDVIQLDASSGAVFMDNGVVRDLSPYIAQDPDFDLSIFFEQVVNVFSRGERLYSIPLDFTPMVMYYNKTMFDEAGLPYPQPGWSWADFLDLAQKLTIRPNPDEPPTQYGFNFENVMPFWVLWLWTNGGDVLSPDGTQATGYFDSPESIEAMQFLIDLAHKYHVTPTLAERDAAGVDLFLDKRAAMDLKGHWLMIDYRARGIEVGVAPLPTNNVEPSTVAYESGLSITTGAKHPDLAWEYIKHFTSESVQKRRVASGLAISGNKRAAAHFAGDPVEDEFIRIVQYARSPWGARVERYTECEDLGREMMKDIQYAGKPVPEAMRETAKLMDAAVKVP